MNQSKLADRIRLTTGYVVAWMVGILVGQIVMVFVR